MGDENGAPLQRTPKFIYLMRDPADLLWARFNFWTTAGDANIHVPGRWTQEDNFRSPEYFQVMLEAEGLIHGSYNLTHEYLKNQYHLQTVDEMMRMVGEENVMIVNSADLEEPHVDAFIRRLSNWTGLSVEGFDQKILYGRTNSGSNLKTRGAGRVISNDDRSAGVYEISGSRPMLPKSRAFIYERAQSFCEEVNARYRVNFGRCLGFAARSVNEQQDRNEQQQLSMLRGHQGPSTIAEWYHSHDQQL